MQHDDPNATRTDRAAAQPAPGAGAADDPVMPRERRAVATSSDGIPVDEKGSAIADDADPDL